MSENELAALVTRNAMVGVSKLSLKERQCMNGVHDMGGMQEMGPIRHEKDEPVFHAAWEGRIYAINVGPTGLQANGTWMRGVMRSNCYLLSIICSMSVLRAMAANQ